MPDSIRDLSRKYSDTWVRWDNRPVLVRDFRGTERAPVALIDDEANPGDFATIPWGEVDPRFPTLGCINLDKMAVYAARHGARQWKWGLSLANISTNYLAQQATYIAGIRDGTRDKDAFLRAMLYPQYPTYEEAYAKVANGEAAACAFTNRLWLGVDLYSDFPVVGYKQWIVGKVQPNGKIKLRRVAAPVKEMIQLYREVV